MTDPASPQQDALAELLELGRSALREAHARLLAADDDHFDGRMQSYNRAARSVRQTVALYDRRARDRRLADKDDRLRADAELSSRTQDHKTRIRLAIDPLIRREADGSEAEALESELEDFLDAAALDDGFLETALRDQIHRACKTLGLSPPPPGDWDREAVEGVPRTDEAGLSRQPRVTPSVASGDSSPNGGATEERDADDRQSSA